MNELKWLHDVFKTPLSIVILFPAVKKSATAIATEIFVDLLAYTISNRYCWMCWKHFCLKNSGCKIQSEEWCRTNKPFSLVVKGKPKSSFTSEDYVTTWKRFFFIKSYMILYELQDRLFFLSDWPRLLILHTTLCIPLLAFLQTCIILNIRSYNWKITKEDLTKFS